jgi:hypothetical protein
LAACTPTCRRRWRGVAVRQFPFCRQLFSLRIRQQFCLLGLALEEQFYLLFPLLIVLCRKHLVWALLALVAVQLFTLRTPLLMVVRTDALALGVLLALWSAQPSWQRWQPTFAAAVGRGISADRRGTADEFHGHRPFHLRALPHRLDCRARRAAGVDCLQPRLPAGGPFAAADGGSAVVPTAFT